MIRFKVLPSSGFVEHPWHNGLGVTKDIAQGPDSARWAWRLSLAQSQIGAPFSHFEGVDRHLVLLSGAGLDLRFDDGEILSLTSSAASAVFAGERGVIGVPASGPTSQLNAMWRRHEIDADVTVKRIDHRASLALASGSTTFVYIASGALAAGPDLTRLRTGDVAMAEIDGDADELMVSGDARVVIVTFQTRAASA